VAIEGPYGAFTHHARHTDRVVLVAAGVGVTPVRALLEDLPRHVDVVAILRGRSRRDLVLRDELAHLVGERGGRYSLSCNPDLTLDAVSAMLISARTVLRYPPEFAVIVKIVGSSVGNRTDFHAHSDFNSLCRRKNSTAPAAPPRWGLFLGKSRPRPSPFRRYPQMMRAIALARHRLVAAELHRDIVHVAERPMAIATAKPQNALNRTTPFIFLLQKGVKGFKG
jgi:hypothetical protein